jgi:hypothetical protein
VTKIPIVEMGNGPSANPQGGSGPPRKKGRKRSRSGGSPDEEQPRKRRGEINRQTSYNIILVEWKSGRTNELC